MSLLNFFVRKTSAPVARERLQILLAHERVALGPRDLVTTLRQEILAVIAKHVPLDPDKVAVQMNANGAVSTLEIDIELPAVTVPAGERRVVSDEPEEVELPPRKRALG
jgi:cell division topological specificity factor